MPVVIHSDQGCEFENHLMPAIDLLPAVMMAYRSSVHESTGFSPYRLMLGEECTLPMDAGLP